MNQQCAIGSPPSASSANAPCLGALFLFVLFLIISTLPLLGTAATDVSDTRFNSLGHRMMCICDAEPAAMGPKGCRQVLLECTHNNCEALRRMRRELSAVLEKGDTDDMVLDSFVKEYGTSVLVAPRMTDIPTRLWVLAFGVLLALVASIVFVLVRKRHSRHAMVEVPRSDSRDIDPNLLRRVRHESEGDDER